MLHGSGWKATGLRRRRALKHGLTADAVVRLRSGSARTTLIVEVSATPRLGGVREKALLLRYVLSESGAGGATALAFLVPRVTPALARLLRELNVGYLDLAGACHLQWPGLVIERPGDPRRTEATSSPRPSPALDPGQVFGPRAPRRHRVLRVLLSWPGRRWHQVELAQESRASVFTVHGVVEHLLVEHQADQEGRGPEKVVFLVHPADLLDAWVPFWRAGWRRLHLRAGGARLANRPGDLRPRSALLPRRLGLGSRSRDRRRPGPSALGSRRRENGSPGWSASRGRAAGRSGCDSLLADEDRCCRPCVAPLSGRS